MPLDKTRKRQLFAELAPVRDAWKARKPTYHREVERLCRFLIPEGASVFEIRCGTGDLLHALRHRRGLGIDLSLAVEAAHANLSDRDNVRILQADLFHLPFRPGTFDIVYSLGVLHHTPDCEKAFRQLVSFLRPGGRLCVWVYAHLGPWVRAAHAYRRMTVRMPRRFLHALCRLAIPWYHVCRLPLVGPLLFTLFSISMHPNPEWRILDTFDLYSPTYRSLHTFPEVYRWFTSEGFGDIRLLDVPVALSGRRRSPGERS